MHPYAEYSGGVAKDSDIPLLRELMAWDALCPNSSVLGRNEFKILGLNHQPSPLHWSRQVEWPWAINESELRPWYTCLDIGGSWSVLKYAIARRTRRVICIDNDPEAVRKGIESQQIIGVGRISHVCGDCRALPFADASFDRVFGISVFEHMEQGHIQAVDESLRVLKPGGIAMISMDLALEGKGKDNFYLGYKDISSILKHVKLPTAPAKNTNGAKMKEGVTIAVVLMRLVK